ncbi:MULTISPECIES: hypothetical protein [Rhodococcus]|uniref:Uncharacterized protein n=1 Tax=Rhodococcus opacus RKJ300 = JCM 13270 TaxID=1165867 RepID=I0WU16_RHOOP|nr:MULTISPECIES: hypothetical protein [Rhodococcus]EID79882.1 hypothetical protein W59_11166 [Rhodococcus opacus RKJ300 = JCM 13270]KAF0959242.1 hypothetical protein MLGJGCBP_07676 [Rhodococcus sp. T7]UOT08126.1 hypothetical protein MPY17_37835 [Rhodococcus opacus]
MRNVIPFPLPGSGNDLDPGLTSRQARMVAVIATTFAATVYGDADALAGRVIESAEQGSLLATLPSVTWGQDTGWRRQMSRAFDDLAADIATGRDPEPTCPAEVVALHLVLAAAAEHAAAGDLDMVVADLPVHWRDGDWSGPTDVLCGDREVPTPPDGAPTADGVVVDPAAWFVPFDAHRSRDPDRGHRF